MEQTQKQIIEQRASILALQARKNHETAPVVRNWLGLAHKKATRENEPELAEIIKLYENSILN